jgi:hypothetical protein
MLEAAHNSFNQEDEEALARKERIRCLEARIEESHKKDMSERSAAILAAIKLNDRLETELFRPRKVNGHATGLLCQGPAHEIGKCSSSSCPHEKHTGEGRVSA